MRTFWIANDDNVNFNWKVIFRNGIWIFLFDTNQYFRRNFIPCSTCEAQPSLQSKTFQLVKGEIFRFSWEENGIQDRNLNLNRFWAKHTVLNVKMIDWEVITLIENFIKKTSANVFLLAYSVKCVFSIALQKTKKKISKMRYFSAIFIHMLRMKI